VKLREGGREERWSAKKYSFKRGNGTEEGRRMRGNVYYDSEERERSVEGSERGRERTVND
jgi:hypothetical protein